MKILILGAGQVGRTVARHFSREEANDVTVVDIDEDVLRDLQDRLDVHTVSGNAAHPGVLQAAGAAEADILVALTNSDEVNMVACEVAFCLFRTPTKIARIRAAAYTGRPQLFGEQAIAVDVFISPEQLVTEYLEQLIRHPGALQVLEFAAGRVRLAGARAEQGGSMTGHSLRELPDHLEGIEARVVAIYRGGRGVPAVGDTVIEEGDEVFFLAARDDVHRVIVALRKESARLRRVVIAGGGSIGLRLARALEDTAQIKLIEHDMRRARVASEQLENTIVLAGDAADEELLIEENIDSADVFAAVTNSEEANILSAMLAKRLGARKVMALVNRPSYVDLIESGSIDVAIAPQIITIGSLLAHVRRGELVRVYSLRRGAAEAIEAIARGAEGSSRVVGRMVGEIELPEGAAIGAIVRGEQVIIAHHDTPVQSDDHVILFLPDRRHIDAIEHLFTRAAP
jgi:trk system potassium uptake protein TrkA